MVFGVGMFVLVMIPGDSPPIHEGACCPMDSTFNFFFFE